MGNDTNLSFEEKIGVLCGILFLICVPSSWRWGYHFFGDLTVILKICSGAAGVIVAAVFFVIAATALIAVCDATLKTTPNLFEKIFIVILVTVVLFGGLFDAVLVQNDYLTIFAVGKVLTGFCIGFCLLYFVFYKMFLKQMFNWILVEIE